MASSQLAKETAHYLVEKFLICENTETCRETLCCIVTAVHNINKNPNFNLNPNPSQLIGFGIYIASYLVLRLASDTRSWYGVLGFKDHGCAGVDEIKKRYEAFAKLFDQPEACASVEVKSANKLITEAWEVLSDSRRKEAYDMLMGFDNNNNNSHRDESSNPCPASSSWPPPPPPLSSSPCWKKIVRIIKRAPLK